MNHTELLSHASARLQAMRENLPSISRRPIRNASIVIPDVSRAAIVQLERNLIANFGGYTVLYGDGVWADPATGVVHSDNVNVYNVAMENTFTNNTTFRAIARVAGIQAKQLSIMVTFADGNVEQIEIDSAEANDTRQLAKEAATSTDTFNWMMEATND